MPARMITAMLVVMLTPAPAYAQDVNSQLIEAAQNGQAEKVQALLESGADVDGKNKNGWTALIYAALQGHPDVVRILLDAGADVNAKANADETALMAAADVGHTDIVRTLLDAGADVNGKGSVGRTALMALGVFEVPIKLHSEVEAKIKVWVVKE